MENFDTDLLARRRERAHRRIMRSGPESAGFLHIHALEEIASRIEVTNREFSRPAILFDGPFSGIIGKKLHSLANVGRLPEALPLPARDESGGLGLEPESRDLIISVFDLHWMNDLPGALAQINRALVPDGLFMAALPGATTLMELRRALLSNEAEISGGAAPRIDPFAEVRQFGDLLQRTGFRLPVADQEELAIRYSRVSDLVRDLRDAAAASTLTAGNPRLRREAWDRTVADLERARDASGKFPVTVEIVQLSGWKHHESQQKPLQPGSATEKLADALSRQGKS
jgi:SAM-dependent methyltransferase